MIEYTNNILGARYFWWHLALADIRIKYRRSFLGLAWAVIQPFMMTLLLTFVMGSIFHSDIKAYAPFIFSGLIFWECIVSCSVAGCSSFINAEGYIKQFKHPLMIYSLRAVIPCFVNFFYAFMGLIVWVLIWKPSNIGLEWFTLFFSFVLLFLFAWPLSTINAFIGIKFRDYSQLLMILLQIVYYISPIFFLPKLFANANLGFLIEYNPIAHALNLFRKPLLEGIYPSFDDYAYTILAASFFWLCASTMVRVSEKKVIFYI